MTLSTYRSDKTLETILSINTRSEEDHQINCAKTKLNVRLAKKQKSSKMGKPKKKSKAIYSESEDESSSPSSVESSGGESDNSSDSSLAREAREYILDGK